MTSRPPPSPFAAPPSAHAPAAGDAGRVPIPLRAWADSHGTPHGTARPEELLQRVRVEPDVIEEMRPLSRCLEWELSDLYWSLSGVLPFAEGDVPFIVNNTGALSESAAVLLFTCCQEGRLDEGPITVLELGAGTGLFARFFLDAFRALCEQEGRDYYDRLRYLVTDRSARTVTHWQERGLFDDHPGRVLPGVCAAEEPGRIRAPSGEPLPVEAPLAVLCNYVLDVLPAAVLARGPKGEPRQLCVRTRLTRDRELVGRYTALGPDALRELAASSDPADRARLLPLTPLLDFELDFLPLGIEELAHVDEALTWGAGLERVLLSHGALTCLERALGLLDPRGFVLVNDYGPVQPEQTAAYRLPQRFGGSSAFGLNFPLIERHVERAGAVVDRPEGDDERAVHARLLCARDLPRTRAAFHARFSASALAHTEGPAQEARRHVGAGRAREALDSYLLALSRSPREWTLIGEAAEFVASELKDYAAALELCRTALELNPCYSAWLWNVFGDCLYCLGRHKEAHEAYLQAERVNPGDPRTNLNLAYTHAHFGRHEQALAVIARGLASAHRTGYRDRLLEKQQQILAEIAARWTAEQQRMLQRSARSA